MKRNFNNLILSLIVLTGLALANCEDKGQSKPSPKRLAVNDRKANLDERKKWEASPDGVQYKAWQASDAGKKVQASYDRIEKHFKTFADMEATVTSVTFQRPNAKPSGPKWLIVRIDGADYMMQFAPVDFQRLDHLKVNDKIIVKSRSAGFSHNHPYLILSGDYIAQDDKVLFKRDFSKNKGC